MDFENNQAPVQQAPVAPQAPYQAPVAPQAPYAPVAPQQAQLPQANKAKSKLPLIVGAVAAVVVVALLISLIGGSGYKKALKNYLAYSFEQDTSNIESLLPESVWNDLEDDWDMDRDEIIDEFAEDLEEEAEWMEEEEITIDYEIVSYEKLDEDDLDDIKETLEDYYDIDEDDVGNKAYKAEVEYTVSYDDDEEDEDLEVCIVKIEGDWYVVSENGYFMAY